MENKQNYNENENEFYLKEIKKVNEKLRATESKKKQQQKILMKLYLKRNSNTRQFLKSCCCKFCCNFCCNSSFYYYQTSKAKKETNNSRQHSISGCTFKYSAGVGSWHEWYTHTHTYF